MLGTNSICDSNEKLNILVPVIYGMKAPVTHILF